MFHMPMSSPMMTTMLGFCACCAVAGALVIVTAASEANKPNQIVLLKLMMLSLLTARNRPDDVSTHESKDDICWVDRGAPLRGRRPLIDPKTNSTVDRDSTHRPDVHSCILRNPLLPPHRHHSTHPDLLGHSPPPRSSASSPAHFHRPRSPTTPP